MTRRRFRAPAAGYLTVRLDAPRGDWDVAVFRRRGGQPVAASAFQGGHEVASGFVARGDRLAVQACRRTGRGRGARLRVSLARIDPPARRQRLSLVSVATPAPADKARLARLGLDLTEHAEHRSVSVVLHGPGDAARLRAHGFDYRVEVADLAAQAARDRAADRRYAARVHASALPSGRTTYRRLFHYSNEMKALADANPDLVKPITLPHLSWGGRPVEGLQITTNPGVRDGKPVFLQLGLHHAREWPSGEHTLEWAYELIAGYRAGDARTRRLVEGTRTIVVPVSNPDGFNFSREAGELAGHGGGDTGFNSSSAEYHRKNCAPDASGSGCRVSYGVDPNRNWGDLWGGPGASTVVTVETYRGPSPFSEPETQNVRELISNRQVVTMITNHTFGNEILRQPGKASEGPTPDEPLFSALGAEMAAQNGYDNIFSYEIGDHVGTTDGWSYYTTGGLGYVFEIGASAFHPPFAQTVGHYDGSATPGDGNREAYFIAQESTANPARHGVLTGTAPAGTILRLTKEFDNRTSISGLTTHERFDSTMEVPPTGRFEWHVNQSARPLVPGERWTLTCERPEGQVLETRQVEVARGQSLDLGQCAPPALDSTPLNAKLRATYDGRRYRARVTGSLLELAGPAGLGPQGSARCAGRVAIALRARNRRVRSGNATVDGVCGFARSFTFRRRALPRSLRRKGHRIKLTAVARWGGNGSLPAAEQRVTSRVRRRR